MQYIWCRHIKNHAVFDFLDDEEAGYDMNYIIKGKQYGLSTTKFPLIDKNSIKNENRYQQIKYANRPHLERQAYQLIYKIFPKLQNEGQAILQGGRICIPNGKKDYKEELIKIKT